MATSSFERQTRYLERQLAAGMVRVTVLVPADGAATIRRKAHQLRIAARRTPPAA
jgi:hypothetical protein